MSKEFTPVDTDVTFLTLSYATRLLASETELDNLIHTALDTLADFGRSERVELLSIEDDKDTAKVLGVYKNGTLSTPEESIPLEGTYFEEIINTKRPGVFTSKDGVDQLYLPLIGSENNVIGLVIIDLNEEKILHEPAMHILVILATLIAIALEHTRFYRLAMFDGLTGLYVRRQFDAKLSEEIARVKRYGSNLAIFIADIDNFKHFNDTYGHLQGDIVLQELSSILRNSIRKDVDIPCRYGGEELVVVMPNTDVSSAYRAAERFRMNCEEFDFPGQNKPLKVTVSIGVAAIDIETILTSDEFIQRADDMLYSAKESGRNQTFLWNHNSKKNIK